MNIPLPFTGMPAMNLIYSLSIFGNYRNGGISLLLPTFTMIIIAAVLSSMLFIYNKKEASRTSRLRIINILSVLVLVLYVYIGTLQTISFMSGNL